MNTSKISNFFRYFTLKTFYFNFKYLPFNQAIKFPVYIARRTHLLKTNGKVIIHGPVSSGMIRIGFGMVGIFDRRTRAIWEVNGEVHFYGNAILKFGTKVSVGPIGQLHIGDHFRFSTNSSIICFKEIRFGKRVRVSWDTIFMDTDFHTIENLDGEKINNDRPIIIGNDVWIGMRCSILKGTKLENNVICASNSVLTKHIPGTNQIVGGYPARVIKTNVDWQE
jgi:acetyltransferase-like isoleucine patch superfamily enzyme